MLSLIIELHKFFNEIDHVYAYVYTPEYKCIRVLLTIRIDTYEDMLTRYFFCTGNCRAYLAPNTTPIRENDLCTVYLVRVKAIYRTMTYLVTGFIPYIMFLDAQC